MNSEHTDIQAGDRGCPNCRGRAERDAEWREAVEEEPEFPDQIPEEMWIALKAACAIGDRDTLSQAFRIAVRLTKSGILERVKMDSPTLSGAKIMPGWKRQTDEGGRVHVLPEGDQKPHIESGMYCPCKPRLEENGKVVIHYSYEGL
jgi:hypothetical protein